MLPYCRCKFGQLGPGKSQFNSPHGFCLGVEEDIIVADTNNHRIQVFEKSGEFKYQFGIPGRFQVLASCSELYLDETLILYTKWKKTSTKTQLFVTLFVAMWNMILHKTAFLTAKKRHFRLPKSTWWQLTMFNLHSTSSPCYGNLEFFLFIILVVCNCG